MMANIGFEKFFKAMENMEFGKYWKCWEISNLRNIGNIEVYEIWEILEILKNMKLDVNWKRDGMKTAVRLLLLRGKKTSHVGNVNETWLTMYTMDNIRSFHLPNNIYFLIFNIVNIFTLILTRYHKTSMCIRMLPICHSYSLRSM